MTPAEFEWAREQLERAYERREIGKLMFVKRMSALGFSLKTSREFMDETDMRRSSLIGNKG